MTLFGFDISHHQPHFDISRAKSEGFDFGIARIGQGAGRRLNGGNYGNTRDRAWLKHRYGLEKCFDIWCGYWYIGDLITPKENALLCKMWMGDPTVPVILDHEDGSGSINHFKATYEAFREAGIKVPFSYIPKWYWSNPRIGSPSLKGLPPLWSSRYVTGRGVASKLYPGDSSTYWEGYGGNEVKLLQYSSSAHISNYSSVDANAFRGSKKELESCIYGTESPKSNQTQFMLME